MVATFERVDGKPMTLGDIKAENIAFDSSSLQLLNSDGANLTLPDDPDFPGAYATFIYMSEEEADGEYTPGWYLSCDGDAEHCKNDFELPFGQGFCMDKSDTGAALVFSGNVRASNKPITLDEHFNYLGNCSPKDLTLGDITAINIAFDSSSLQLLNKDGSNLILDDDPDFPGAYATFIYMSEEEADGEYTVGWYLSCDGDAEYPKNDFQIKAGQGFCMDKSDTGAQIVIPSAL